eukprot:g10803.t1
MHRQAMADQEQADLLARDLHRHALEEKRHEAARYDEQLRQATLRSDASLTAINTEEALVAAHQALLADVEARHRQAQRNAKDQQARLRRASESAKQAKKRGQPSIKTELGENGSTTDTALREPVDFKLRVSNSQVAQGACNITVASTDKPFFRTRLDAMAEEAPRAWPTHHHAPIHGSASTLLTLIPQEVRPAITLNEALVYLRDTMTNTSAPDRVIVAMSAALHDLLTNLRTAQDNRHTNGNSWDTHQNSRGV